jgi:eukaryotic-like serine/threonine-protein kinase
MTRPGVTIAGRYYLIRQLGAGAMGAVWLADDISLRRDVAVKSVRGPLLDSATAGGEGSERAMREARMVARVHHPNAVAIYDVAIHEERPWLVMEYFPSRNLAELVSQTGPLAPRRAAELGAQAAAALDDAHRVGVVHRDVKPANLLISDEGVAKITDFGVARGAGDVTLTGTGEMWGTPAYFAPEVARGEGPTQKADVWSLGATLYFAVEGAPPYGTGPSPLVVLGRIANQPVPRPQGAGPMAPVLARLLERDPDARPTMAEAARMLADVAGRPVNRYEEGAVGAMAPAVADDEGPGPTAEEAAAQTASLGTFAGGDAGGVRGAGGTAGDAERRHRTAMLAGLTAAVLLALGAIAWLGLAGDGDTEDATATGPPTSATTGPPTGAPTGGATEAERSGPSPSRQSHPETGAPDRSRAEQPRPDRRTPQEQTRPEREPREKTSSEPRSRNRPGRDRERRGGAEFTEQNMESAVADYYAIMPDDTRTGFSLLGPSLRSQGFDSYDSFWDGIESVSVDDLEASPSNRSVTGTVVFVERNGDTSTETHRWGLVADDSGEGLLINTDDLIG